MSNQLFEAVPVSEKPEKTGKYVALETNYGIEEWMEMRYDKFSDSWFDGAHCFHPTHWLKPIAPAKEASTGQAWEIRVLRDALERVRTMKRLPGENNDTYVFNRCWHIADAALSTPSHTVEDDAQKQIKELHAKLIRSAGLTRYGHQTLPINCVPGTERLLTEEDKAVGYLRGEYELQVEKMKAIGINVESMFFEQCVNTLLFMYEKKIMPVEEEIKRHSDTWDEAVAHTKEDNSAMNKTAYLEQLENKLKQL